MAVSVKDFLDAIRGRYQDEPNKVKMELRKSHFYQSGEVEKNGLKQIKPNIEKLNFLSNDTNDADLLFHLDAVLGSGVTREDFENQQVNEQPTGWDQISGSGDFEVKEKNGENVLEWTAVESENNVLVWSELSTHTDEEIVGDVRASTANEGNPGVGLRVSGENASLTGVFARSQGDGLRVRAFSEGSAVFTEDFTGFSPESGVWYRIKMRIDGNTVYAKVWQRDETEPENWMVEYQDASLGNTITSGKAGLYSFDNRSVVDFDNIIVGKVFEKGGISEPILLKPGEVLSSFDRSVEDVVIESRKSDLKYRFLGVK